MTERVATWFAGRAFGATMVGRAFGATLAVCIVLQTVFSGTAAAQSAGDVAAARALFDEGVRLVDAGDLAGGEDRFRRSLALNEVGSVAFNLAVVLARQGRVAEAVDYYSIVASSPTASAELREQASQRGRQLGARLARLRLTLNGPTGGVTLRIGQRELPPSASGTPIQVDPGSFRVEALRSGGRIAFRDVTVNAGTESALTLDLPGTEVWQEWWLWTLVSVVLVGGGVGIGLGFGLSGTDPSHVGNIPPGVFVLP